MVQEGKTWLTGCMSMQRPSRCILISYPPTTANRTYTITPRCKAIQAQTITLSRTSSSIKATSRPSCSPNSVKSSNSWWGSSTKEALVELSPQGSPHPPRAPITPSSIIFKCSIRAYPLQTSIPIKTLPLSNSHSTTLVQCHQIRILTRQKTNLKMMILALSKGYHSKLKWLWTIT